VPRGAIRFPTTRAPTSGDVRATLRLHCHTREVVFRYAAARSGEMLDARGTMRLDMRDFGIAVPQFLGLRAEPYVTVTASFRARDVE
jgi:hypothetical protein